MPVGEHQFPFAFVLPQNIPSSYENRNGKVRYSVKAVVDRSWKTNYTCKLPFSVNTFLDLNTISEAEVWNSISIHPLLSDSGLFCISLLSLT